MFKNDRGHQHLHSTAFLGSIPSTSIRYLWFRAGFYALLTQEKHIACLHARTHAHRPTCRSDSQCGSNHGCSGLQSACLKWKWQLVRVHLHVTWSSHFRSQVSESLDGEPEHSNQVLAWSTPDKSNGKAVETHQTRKGEPQTQKQSKFVWICPTGIGGCVSRTMSDVGGELQPRRKAAVIKNNGITIKYQLMYCVMWLALKKRKTSLICFRFFLYNKNTFVYI